MKLDEIKPVLTDIEIYGRVIERCFEAVKGDEEIPRDSVKAARIYTLKLEARLDDLRALLRKADEES